MLQIQANLGTFKECSCMGFLIGNTRLTDSTRQWVLRLLIRQVLFSNDSKDWEKNRKDSSV